MNLFKGFGGKKGYAEAVAKDDAVKQEDKLDAVYREEEERQQSVSKYDRDITKLREEVESEKYDVTDATPGPRTSSIYSAPGISKSGTTSEDINSIFQPRERRIQKINDAAFDSNINRRLAADKFKSNKKLIEKEREVDYSRAKNVEKHRLQKEYDYKIEKARMGDKSRRQFEQKYGPSRFNVSGIGGALGGISQHRNYVQTQEISKLKRRNVIEGQRLQLDRLQEARGVNPRSQSMDGFGQPLSLGGGLGMSLGPSNQQRYDEYGQPIRKDPMAMNMPGFGGGLNMGGNSFAPQGREPVQEAPRREFTPTRVVQRAPRSEVYAPGTGHEAEAGAIYIREMETYGPKYTRVSPEEVTPGESIFKKIKTSYGYKYIKLRGNR